MIRFVSFAWVGLVLGVSFLATPVKFRAESLTLPVALEVGRATFHALGRVEWVLSAVLVGLMARVISLDAVTTIDVALVAGVIAIVLAQALWLIPALDARVALIISGETPSSSHLHLVFIGFEVAKVGLLLGLGALTGGNT